MGDEMSNRQKWLKKLSGAQFAAFETRLYLDTHPEDQAAFSRLESYQKQANQYKREFEEQFGPLTANDLFGDTRYEWLNAPWPWELEKEAK